MRIFWTLVITTLLATLVMGCTRELRSKDEEPWQPFEFDRIPTVGENNGTAPATEGSTAQPEPGETLPPPDMLTDEGTEAAEDPEVAGLIQQGRDALNASQWETAIEHFRHALELDEGNTVALYNMGYAYRQLENWDMAIEYAARAVDSDPDRIFMHQNLGLAYLGKGDVDKAIDEFETELINHPEEPRLAGLSEQLAQIYLSKDLLQEAFDAAIRAVNLEPEVASHYVTLAHVHIKNGALDQAIEAFRKATELAPDNVQYLVYLADTLWEAGRKDEARTLYGRALEMEPGLADIIDAERFPTAETESETSNSSDSPL
jgi:tetratricopeptide (TPR) repeat protein